MKYFDLHQNHSNNDLMIPVHDLLSQKGLSGNLSLSYMSMGRVINDHYLRMDLKIYFLPKTIYVTTSLQ